MQFSQKPQKKKIPKPQIKRSENCKYEAFIIDWNIFSKEI